MTMAHRYLAYAIILLSQVTILLGIVKYYERLHNIPRGVMWCAINIGVFWIPLGLLESLHQRNLKLLHPFNKPRDTLDQDDFNRLVFQGRQLAVVDDLVVDLSSFVGKHPGGRFVIEMNVGRDISKYFHGGYSFDGNLGLQPATGHRHSNYARMIVNQLSIAMFDRSTEAQSTVCRVIP